MGGTLLGLYFATIGIVVSTAYAEAPDNVRALFLRDRASRVYIRSVSLLVLAGVITLAGELIQYEFHLVTPVMLSIVALFSVVSLVQAGNEAFNFFNPASLAYPLTRDFSSALGRAVQGGPRWRDPSFQASYQRAADQMLTTYRALADFTVRRGADEHRLDHLARGILVLGLDYADHKSEIPSESYWYERIYEHADWFIADEIQVNFAVETGTGISPKEVPDLLWVERRLVETIRVILDPLLEQDDLRGAARVTGEMGTILKTLASRGRIEEGLLIWRAVSGLIWSALEPRALGLNLTPVAPQQAGALALADADATAPVEILLGLVTWSEELRGDGFEIRIDRSLNSDEALYAARAPAKLLSLLENLRAGVAFEQAAEGKTVTPTWYPRHLSARTVIEFVDQTVETVLAEMETSVRDRAQAWAGREGGIISSVLLARGLETSNKLKAHIPRLANAVQALEGFRGTDDQYWPTQEFARHRERIAEMEVSLVRALAGLLPSLAARPRDPSVPDFFGHAYAMVHDAAFEALVGGREVFRELFPFLFDSALKAFGRTHEALARHDPQTRFVFSTESVVDLLELSGYALLFAELDESDAWDVAKGTWDAWLDGHQNASAAVQFIHGTIAQRDSIFALAPRSGARAARQQELSRILRERGIVEESYFPGSTPQPPAHESPIVRTFAPPDHGIGIMEDAEDLFYVEYVAKRPEAAGLDLPGRSRFLAEQLELERAHGEEEEQEEE